jgi:hydroxymethylglutaryl-CoA lyase
MQKIIIEEQGLRDGLQTVAQPINTATKIAWAEQLIKAGVSSLQLGSFVNPKLVPQMADTEQLFAALLPKYDKVTFSALVLNKKGVERAIACGVKHLSISLSASNTHSLKNTNKTIEQAQEEIAYTITEALQAGIYVRAGVQCAFGCRYEGQIKEEVVFALVKYLISCGAQEIALADSTGMGNPVQVKKILEEVKKIAGNKPIALHLHNTENAGYANVVAALQAGVFKFDTAFGGLGGCPFIQGATGNIATEDTVHLLHKMGYETGIDIEKIKPVSKAMQEILQEPLPGLMYKLKV